MPWFRTALAAFWRKYWLDLVLVVALAALSFFVLWISLEPIEDGGDPLDNWFFVRQWRYETDLGTTKIDHHAARVGIHWLTYLVQHVFGPEPQYYFIPTLIIANACAWLTYLLGRQTAGRTVGFLAALLVIDNSMLAEAAGQLRRGIFECFYVLLTLNCLVRYVDTTGSSRKRWLWACAVAMFVGYLTEVPILYVVPGIVFVMWRASGSLRDPILYSALLFGLFLAETAVYALFTHYWSRLHVLFSFHLGRPVVERGANYLFSRFTDAEGALKLAFYPFFFAAPALLVWRRSLKNMAVILPTAAFLFLMTFLVRSIDPLVTFTSNRTRYMVLAVAPCFVTICTALVELARLGISWLRQRPPFAGRDLPVRLPPALLVAGGLLLMAYTASRGWQRYGQRPSPFPQIRAYYALVNDTYARGLPIIAKVTSRRRGLPRARSLHWVYKGFLSDALLVKDGSLPSFSYSTVPKELNNREHYLAPRELTPERVKELRASGCTLEVVEISGDDVAIRPKVAKLPARCVP